MVFDWLLRAWLQNVARDKIREKVVAAAQERMAAGRAEPSSAASRECDVGLVFALEVESGGWEDLLGEVRTTRGDRLLVRQGAWQGRRVAVAISGVGQAAAARATEALIQGHRPRWVIAAGFSAALRGELARHEILVAESLVDPSGRQIEVDLARAPVVWSQLPRARIGRLLSGEPVAGQPREKRALGERYAAWAMDTASCAVAEVCRRQPLPFLAVRAVSNTLDEVLPADIQRLARSESAPRRWGAVLAAALDRPGSVQEMLQLRQNTLAASDRLAKFLAALIPQLVPAEEQGE
jgi:adenosylhomocysteine nucleosidase